jgi:uncharacterized membrane protein YdcZ (DUF606 family)
MRGNSLADDDSMASNMPHKECNQYWLRKWTASAHSAFYGTLLFVVYLVFDALLRHEASMEKPMPRLSMVGGR